MRNLILAMVLLGAVYFAPASQAEFLVPTEIDSSSGIQQTSEINLITEELSANRQEFRIEGMYDTGSQVVDHNSLTGDDRGGIAVGSSIVMYTGDSSTARYQNSDLTDGTRLNIRYEALVSDLKTGQIYSLANGTTPLSGSGGTINALVFHDSETGMVTSDLIELSEPIIAGSGTGIFAGYGYILLNTGSRAYSISLETGEVEDLGQAPSFSRQSTENWAYWGIAEWYEGTNYFVYVRNSQTIARTAAVPNGQTTILASFSNLSDMACITAAPVLNRWYFHHEGSSQFGGSYETLGYADASFYISPADSLSLTPRDDITFFGWETGPFIQTQDLYLGNASSSNLQWTVSTSASWLSISLMAGELQPQEIITLTASVTNATELPPGTYQESLVISNLTSGIVHARDVVLTVQERLDHFEWTPIGTNQIVGTPIPVVITAKDYKGDTLTTFTDTVEIKGFADGSVPDGTFMSGLSIFDSPDLSRQGNHGTYTLGYSFTPSHPITVTHFRHYFGSKVSLWTDSGVLLASENVASNPGTWTETELAEPVSLAPGVRYRISVYSNNQNYYWSYDLPNTFAHGSIHQGYEIFGDAFPTQTDSVRWWYVDIGYQTGIPLAITPTNTAHFTNGVWEGLVTILDSTTNATLRADDGRDHTGDSNPFIVHPRILSVLIPESLTEGAASAQGRIEVNFAPESDILITLGADYPEEISLPTEIELHAGETNVLFEVQADDDRILDGSTLVTVTASSTNYYQSGSATILVHDNETTTLSITLPQSTYEGAGNIVGTIIAGAVPERDVTVEVLSNNPSEIGNGSTVIPAGQTFASFTLPVLDDALIDGLQTVTIEAHVENWQSGYASVFVFDDETTGLHLQVPASLTEGEGAYTNGGLVQLPAVTSSDVYVQLTASDETELSIPDYVTIPAGTNQVMFAIAAADDAEQDGTTTVTVLAQAPGYIPDSASVSVLDNDPHHFLIEGVTNITLRESLNITVSARTLDDAPLETFNGEISLTASGDRGDMNIIPAVLTNINSGVASGAISFETFANDITLTAISGGVSSTSGLFNVFSPLMVVSPDNLTNTLVVAGETATCTMTISNAGNANLEYTIMGTGDGDGLGLPTTALVAHFPFNGNANDESGNGHNGTVSGATLTSDRFGQLNSAYSFDGVNDLVIVPDHNDFTITDQSICAWIKTTDKGNRCILSSFGPYTYTPRYSLRLTENTGRGRYELDPDYFAPVRAAVGTTDLADGEWHFVVGIRESSAGRLKIYVDGVLQNTAASGSYGTLNPSHNIWIGGQANGASGYFSGSIDEVRIYNKILSDQEVMDLYNEIDPALLSSRVSWLEIDPAAGTVLPGESKSVSVTFDASELALADGTNTTLTLLQNMRIDTNNAIEVSMWAVPPAPVMTGEPESTMGESNEVFWSAVDGTVQYQVVAATATNTVPEQQSGWLTATNYTFVSLSTNTLYYYRTRASVNSSIGLLAGPWSGWVWSVQGAALSDSDGDGMSDAWELQYFGNLTTAGALSDFDGDGQPDCNEFVAGMNPTNASSCFMINEVSPATNGFIVYWDAVTGRTYSVYWQDSLTNAFETMATNIFYPQNSYTDQVHQVESSGFYKVQVEKQ